MYPVTILLSCLVIGVVLGDCPHSKFIQNSICDDCRGWKEVSLWCYFSTSCFLIFPGQDCYIPLPCSLYSYRTFIIFLLHALYIPIQGSFIFSPVLYIIIHYPLFDFIWFYYPRHFAAISHVLHIPIPCPSYSNSLFSLFQSNILLIHLQCRLIYLPNSFNNQPMMLFFIFKLQVLGLGLYFSFG